MNEDGSFQEFPAYIEKSSRKPRLLFIVIVFIVIIIAILAGLYFLGASSNSNQSVSPTPEPTQIDTPTPTSHATPSASLSPLPKGSIIPSASPKLTSAPAATKLDRSKLKVAVLNGSGQAGAARTISSHLQTLGYTIQTVGNADTFSYENITVKVKKNKSEYLPVLKKDISTHSPGVAVSASVDNTIETDAEVIVGK